MQIYQKPFLILLNTHACMLAVAQSGGQTGQAAFSASCDFTGCFVDLQSTDDADFHVSWQDSDNGASDVGGYIVTVNINGTVYNLTDNSNDCDVFFDAGTFTLDCANMSLGSGDCIFNGNNTLTIISIEDPQGNVFQPSNEDCNFQNEQG